MRIIVSRTDGIGDVVLTLPMLGVIKDQLPDAEIIFLNSSYTNPIVENCEHVNQVVNWDNYERNSVTEQAEALRVLNADAIIHVFPRPEIARAARLAGIGKRIGTTGRLYHIHTCNFLVRFTRKRSALHEAQLNLKLLKPLGIKDKIALRTLHRFYGLTRVPELPAILAEKLVSGKKNLILHPLSKGSAVEWGTANFRRLIELLPANDFNILLTGTEAEGAQFRSELPLDLPHVYDVSGKASLGELMALIAQSTALVACSTGPLHMAAALGICSVGLYSAKRPMHPGRWAPLGEKATYLVQRLHREAIHPLLAKPAIDRISPKQVKSKLLAC